MKIDPFFHSARPLLNYKRDIAIGLGAALASAVTFGAGLGMILPIMHLLLDKKQSLRSLVQEYLGDAQNPELLRNWAKALTTVLPEDPLQGFGLVMAGLLLLSILGSITTYLHESMAISVSLRVIAHWRRKMFDRLVLSPMELIHREGTADAISRLTNDTTRLAQGYMEITGRSLGDSLRSLAALAGALVLNWKLAGLAVITAPVFALLLRKFGKAIRRATRSAMQEQGRMLRSLTESLGSLHVVKVHDAEGLERRRFAVSNRSMLREQMRARTARALAGPLVHTISHFFMAGIALFAAWLIFRKNVPPKEFMTVMAMLVAAAGSLKPLSKLSNTLSECSAAARRVLDVVEQPVEPLLPAEALKLPSLPRHQRDVLFERVTYRYPSQDQPAIREVTLHVPHGRTCAIVGGNGSGKTTLLSLLVRLHSPEAGRVLVDGVDIAGVRLRSLRRQIAVVSQHAVLYQASIADNIAYGRRHESLARIIEAAKAAHAHDFISALPQGYHTMLGEGGTGLSGGQRQRLCIARALLRDPAILILDEATSQIDAESEARINAAVRELRRNRTTFIIAHRLSTVIDADAIVVMDHGRIVDQGRHSELLERCAIYRMLTQTQLQPA